MRYATLVVDLEKQEPRPGDHSTGMLVRREYIHHYNVLNDGTIIMLTQFRGDLDQARTILDERSDVAAYDIPENGDGLVYIHCELTNPVKSLLSIFQMSEIMLDLPLEFTSDGAVRATVIGDEKSLYQAITQITDLVDIDLGRTGEYRPEDRRLYSLLTKRQREVLSCAVDMGYYEVPRDITLTELAGELGISLATVGEHLQKIEATILSRVGQ